MKRYRIRMTLEFEKDYPDKDCIDEDHVEFHLTESSWCADNVINDIQAYADRKEAEGSCLCDDASFEVLSAVEMSKHD